MVVEVITKIASVWKSTELRNNAARLPSLANVEAWPTADPSYIGL
jgi:hypothetical protein